MRAFGLGALLAAANPKNLALTLAAGATIAQSGLSTRDMWLVVSVFTVLASSSVIAPIAYYLLAPESAARLLNEAKAWLIDNSSTVMLILLLVFGVIFLGQGVSGLTS